MTATLEISNFGREDVQRLFSEALQTPEFVKQAINFARNNLEIFSELTDPEYFDMQRKVDIIHKSDHPHKEQAINPYLTGRQKIQQISNASFSILPEDFTDNEMEEAANQLAIKGVDSYVEIDSMNRQKYEKKELLMMYLFDFALYRIACNQVQTMMDLDPDILSRIDSSFIFLRANSFSPPAAISAYLEKEHKFIRAICFPQFEAHKLESKDQDILGALVIASHELAHLIISDILDDKAIVKGMHSNSSPQVELTRSNLTAAFHEGIACFVDYKISQKLKPTDVDIAVSLSSYIKRREENKASDEIHRIGFELAKFFEEQGLSTKAIPFFVGHMREFFEGNADVSLEEGVEYIKNQVRGVVAS